MSEIKIQTLDTKQTLHPKAVLIDFELPVGMGLICFFHESNNDLHFAEVVKLPFNSVKLPERLSEFSIKILSSRQIQDETDYSSLKAQVELSGGKIEGELTRDHNIRGILSFKDRRLRVERSLQSNGSIPSAKPSMEKKIRVMVVDDSKTIRDLLTKVLSQDVGLEVVAQIDDPRLVERKIVELKPDVITLDIHMPHMDGVTLLERYMKNQPIPTIMISSITKEEGPQVFRALELGAFDYIQKPSFSELPILAPLIIEKVKAACQTRRNLNRIIQNPQLKKKVRTGTIQYNSKSVIAIGSSTGGTEALKAILTNLPEKIPPILVVQHIPPVFSRSLADRLNQLCKFLVKEAEDGDQILPNQVLVAPGGKQMEVLDTRSELRIRITDAPPVNRHKPSVDHLLLSMKELSKSHHLIVGILTGMGADGAVGTKSLFDLGAKTFAQDEATSIVFGMPKEALRLGGVKSPTPLGDIADLIVEMARVK